MSYVRRLLENDREALLRVAADMRERGLDAREVTNALGELDRVIGVVIEMGKPTKAAAEKPAAKKRGRKPRTSEAPRGESDEVFAQGASDTIPPMVGEGSEGLNGEGEEAVA